VVGIVVMVVVEEVGEEKVVEADTLALLPSTVKLSLATPPP